jgi:glycosyltransferase involved in cell wall biosynthesis
LNILFANYGDFATNSMYHIVGFANELCRRGHDCVVAVPRNLDSVGILSDPLFVPGTHERVLQVPNHFPDSQPADIIHAWTPREGVRLFVESYLQKHAAPVVVHLEDNEERLLESYYRVSFDELRKSVPTEDNPIWTRDLSHPNRYRSFVHMADGATLITDALGEFLAPETPRITLNPPVDFDFFSPRRPDPELRAKLGLAADEKVIVYHGSITSANRADLRRLFIAVNLLNREGIPTRLIRAGYNDPDFAGLFGYDLREQVIDLGYLRQELPDLIALADVLVQPGCDDPFNRYRLPSKIPEFLACGRPTIIPATNLGNRMTEGEDVLLLQDGSPGEIAAACRRVFNDPDLSEKLARNGNARARELFNPESETDRLLAFYRTLSDWSADSPWKRLERTDKDQFDLMADKAARMAREIDPEASDAQAGIWSELAQAMMVEREEGRIRLEKANASRDELIADSATQLERIREQEAELEHRQSRMDDLDRQLREVTTDRDAVRVDAATAHQSALHYQARLRETESELNAMQGEINRLLERDARIRSTASWRLTAPLRFLRRLLIDPFKRRN